MSKKGFTMIPNQLIIDEELSKEAKALFVYLRYLSPNFRILRNATLLTKLDMCLSTLQKAKNELMKEGYLVIHRKTSANKYELRLPIKQAPDRVPNTHMGKYQTLNIKKNNTTLYNNISYKKGFKGFKK